MTIATRPTLMTTEELLALPDDGVDRWLIDGQLRQADDHRHNAMTKRNRGHSRVESKIGHVIEAWLETRPAPRGEVLLGEAGFRLASNPDTTVGIDVAYISAEVAAMNTDDDGYVEGAPVLAVEILSPSDRHENVTEKVEKYLAFGVKLVWIVDPRFATITVYAPDNLPQMFNSTQEIDGGTHLPGFRVSVSKIFAR